MKNDQGKQSYGSFRKLGYLRHDRNECLNISLFLRYRINMIGFLLDLKMVNVWP